jgi:tetratricopeptide (TPR) repeat protein
LARRQAPAPPEDPVAVAIGHLRNLEYAEARQQLEAWVAEHPGDLRAWNYLAVTILYREMFERGVLEAKVYGQGGEAFQPSKVEVSPGFQQELFRVLDRAQQIAEQRLQKDPQDKEAMYWLGVAHGTRATYHFTLRKEYGPALHEAKDAFDLHQRLLEMDPDYTDAYLIVGVQHYVIGSLSWFWKMLAALGGRHGSRKEGLAEVKRAAEQGRWAREDAQLMLGVLYQREKMLPQALAVFQEMEAASPRNYLLPQEVASLHEQQNDWPAAAGVYDSMLAKYRAKEPNFDKLPAARLFYLAGVAQRHLEKDQAALALFAEGAALAGSSIYIYRCELQAAELDALNHRDQQARQRYQRVAQAVPATDEGKLARRALKKLEED